MRSILINTLLATSAGPIIADGFACLPEDYNVLASVSVYRVSMCLTQSEFTADSLNGCVFAWKDSEAHGISDTCAAAMYEGIHTTVSGSCSTACDSLIVSNSCIACKAAAWAHTVGMLAPTGQGVCTGTSMQTFEDVSISAVTECGINHASSQAYCVLNHVTVSESCHTCLLHQVDLRVAECEDTCPQSAPVNLDWCVYCAALSVAGPLAVCNAGPEPTTTALPTTTTTVTTTTTTVTTKATGTRTNVSGYITYLTTASLFVILG